MLPDKPLVSIIMAAKDTAPYIADCLKSIVAQTYTNWELIAINDHSTDGTDEILESYAHKDKRIKVVHSKRHKLIPALKEGYAVCTGDLINRMDSDDKMPVDKLEVLVDEWLKHGKGTVIAGGTEHFVDEGEVGGGFLRYEKWLNHIAKNSLHWQEVYKECVIPSHSWIAHREDFEQAGGFEPEVYPEDYDLTFRFYKAGLKVVGIDKVLHHWRDRSERISRTWEEYRDNRYFDLKLRYFFEIDRDSSRPLVVWGAGRNGKDFVKKVSKFEENTHWVCDNEQKVGHKVLNIEMAHFSSITNILNPQILIVVASPSGQHDIKLWLTLNGMKIARDYWFFL